MAKKEAEAKVVLDRVYNVPLRKEFMKVPKYKRSKKAVTALRQFIVKHMKSDDVLIGKYANLFIWKYGIKNPPHHVKVKAVKDDKGIVKVELVDLSTKAKKEIAKAKEVEKEVDEKKAKEEKEKKAKEEQEKASKEGKIEGKLEEKKEEKEEKAKEVQKEELKELKKEQPKLKAPKPAAIPKQVEQRPTAPKSQ